MANLFAIIHISGKENEFLPLNNLDFENKIFYLKEAIAEKVELSPHLIETVYNGCVLDDDSSLSTINPNSIIHIFKKTKKHEKYTANTASNSHVQAQALFTMISHLQITVNSRVNILQKILAGYPEFRRNLGAQALIRDSVLFNTLQQADVIKNVAEKYPIICEAAPFIVTTIKKELTRDASTNNYFSEMATDSTNSSEEENSSLTNQSEQARIRRITRHQLAAALHQAGTSSVNSLSSISQRNSALNAPSNSSVSSNGGISSSLFSNALARALDTISASNPTANNAVQLMETVETAGQNQDSNETGENELPATYREHQYAEQLRVMNQMGFTNFQENLTFLNITSGNIENAINLIMGAHDSI